MRRRRAQEDLLPVSRPASTDMVGQSVLDDLRYRRSDQVCNNIERTQSHTTFSELFVCFLIAMCPNVNFLFSRW